jgi:acyl-CoA synthetase (AMP-forming)/AMP-acid ligase II
MGLYDLTFYDIISRNARSFGDKPAWFEADENKTTSFRRFKDAVDRLASGLQGIGLKKGDRIGVVGKNSLEYFLLYGAASAIGAVMLPINWRLSADEICFNLNDCTPCVVFAGPEYIETIAGLKDQLGSVAHYFSLKQAHAEFSAFDSLMNSEGGFDPSEVSVSNDDGFVIIHTAAVAGKPRGALLSQLNLLCANIHFNYYLQVTPEDVHLNLLPLFHVGGLFMATNSFHAGALNVNMGKFDAEQAVTLIEEKNVSLMFEFSPILSAILESREGTGKDISSLRAVAGLDTAETIEKYQKATGGTFYCLYGQTETSTLATFGAYNDRPGSAGRAVLLAEVRLVDEYDHPVATGAVGEITVKGPVIFKGYWNLPEDNARTFRDGWHHTGDLGRFDSDGFLWYAGRKAEKELIKPGGENVYPVEVEKVILMHPAVERTVVFGVPDPKWKEGIKAVCQLKPGQEPDARQIIDFVGERIARFKRPQYIEFVEAMPLLDDGTPDREEIKKRYGGSQE